MAINLLWRFVWAFIGNRYARWRAILPGGVGFMGAARAYIASFLSGEPQQYIGHNPRGADRSERSAFNACCSGANRARARRDRSVLAAIRACICEMDSCPGVDPGALQPGAPELIDSTAFQSMRAFRGPFVEVHEFVFYVLAAAIILHLIAVVVTEVHEGGSITSAMFTGREILSRKPPDVP